MDEKVSSELGVVVYAAKFDRVKLECSLKSAMRSKSHKNTINFVKKFVVRSMDISLL